MVSSVSVNSAIFHSADLMMLEKLLGALNKTVLDCAQVMLKKLNSKHTPSREFMN